MSDRPPFRRISLVGVGLIGGSWGLALKRRGFAGEIIGCDLAPVLDRALALGAIDKAEPNLTGAVRDADLVVMASPVGAILEQLPEISRAILPRALVTDTGGTKRTILERARSVFGGELLFIGGHPLAGRERSGIESANADLFEGTRYVLTPLNDHGVQDERVIGFQSLIESVGAKSLYCDADTHDRALAFLSHLPQFLSTGLASAVADEDRNRALPLDLAASGFRDSTRLADSPYEIWRDVCLTNQDNIRHALEALIGKLEGIKDELGNAQLEHEFNQALGLRERLRGLQRG